MKGYVFSAILPSSSCSISGPLSPERVHRERRDGEMPFRFRAAFPAGYGGRSFQMRLTGSTTLRSTHRDRLRSLPRMSRGSGAELRKSSFSCRPALRSQNDRLSDACRRSADRSANKKLHTDINAFIMPAHAILYSFPRVS